MKCENCGGPTGHSPKQTPQVELTPIEAIDRDDSFAKRRRPPPPSQGWAGAGAFAMVLLVGLNLRSRTSSCTNCCSNAASEGNCGNFQKGGAAGVVSNPANNSSN